MMLLTWNRITRIDKNFTTLEGNDAIAHLFDNVDATSLNSHHLEWSECVIEINFIDLSIFGGVVGLCRRGFHSNRS